MQLILDQGTVSHINETLKKYKMFAPNVRANDNDSVYIFNSQVRGQSITVVRLTVKDRGPKTPNFDMNLDVYLKVHSPEKFGVRLSYKDFLEGLTTAEHLTLECGNMALDGSADIRIKNEYIDKTVSYNQYSEVHILEEDHNILWSGIIHSKTILPRLRKTVSAYSKDETRKSLQCAYLSHKELVVTNGHILMQQPMAFDSLTVNYDDNDYILDRPIPKKVMEVLQAMSTGRKAPIKITRYMDRIEFISGNIRVLSNLPEDTYPDFPKVIPAHYGHEFHFLASDLQKALAPIESHYKPLQWLFTIHGDSIQVEACDANGVIADASKGWFKHNGIHIDKPITLSYAPSYIKTICKNIVQIRWNIVDGDFGKPSAWNDDVTKTVMILMPMRPPYSVIQERIKEE